MFLYLLLETQRVAVRVSAKLHDKGASGSLATREGRAPIGGETVAIAAMEGEATA